MRRTAEVAGKISIFFVRVRDGQAGAAVFVGDFMSVADGLRARPALLSWMTGEGHATLIMKELTMRHSLLAGAGIASLAIGALVTSTQAAPLGLLGVPAIETQSHAQTVDYRDGRYRCVHVREECRERWGFRTWRWRRCVAARACL